MSACHSALTPLARHQEQHLVFQKLSDEVLAWLPVYIKVQMVVVCGPADAIAAPSSHTSLKSRIIYYPFWFRLTQVFLENMVLRRCC